MKALTNVENFFTNSDAIFYWKERLRYIVARWGYMVLPKSLISKAIEYCTKLWASLMNYLEDGNFHIYNNAIENKIRPWHLVAKTISLLVHTTELNEPQCSTRSSPIANSTTSTLKNGLIKSLR